MGSLGAFSSRCMHSDRAGVYCLGIFFMSVCAWGSLKVNEKTLYYHPLSSRMRLAEIEADHSLQLSYRMFINSLVNLNRPGWGLHVRTFALKTHNFHFPSQRIIDCYDGKRKSIGVVFGVPYQAPWQRNLWGSCSLQRNAILHVIRTCWVRLPRADICSKSHKNIKI